MNKLLLLLLGTSVGLGLISLHLVGQLRSERDNSKSLQARIEALQSTAAQPQALPTPAPLASTDFAIAPPPAPPIPAPAAAQSDLAAAAKEAPAPQMPSPEARMRMVHEHMERQRALLQDPEYREATKAQHKMMLTQSHPDLDRELGLDAEQYDEMLSLLAEQQLRQRETQSWDAVSPTTGTVSADFQRKLQQQQQANDAEMAALLGDEKYREWKDYQSTMGVRHQVTQLRGSLAASGVPLEEDKVKPLLKALVKQQEQMMKDYQKDAQAQRGGMSRTAAVALHTDPTGDQVKWQEQNLERQAKQNKRLRDAVAPILTAEQLRQFEREQNRQMQMQEVQLRMMRAQAEAAARGDVPQPNMFAPDALAVPVR